MTETIRVPDIDNYTLEIVEGVLILTPKTQYITKEELQRTDFTHSSIIKCDIKDNEGNTISNNKIEYKKILVDIWASMPASKLLQTTTFNFKLTNEKKNKGFDGVVDYGERGGRICTFGAKIWTGSRYSRP